MPAARRGAARGLAGRQALSALGPALTGDGRSCGVLQVAVGHHLDGPSLLVGPELEYGGGEGRHWEALVAGLGAVAVGAAVGDAYHTQL